MVGVEFTSPSSPRADRECDPPHPPHGVITTTTTRRLGPSLSSPSTTLEKGSSGMFMFDHQGGDDGTWFGNEDGGGLGGGIRSGSSQNFVGVGGGLMVVGSSSAGMPE